MVFVRRSLQVKPDTLAQKLKALRRHQAIPLELLERKTHIRREYLEALEQGTYEKLPEPMYSRNFIRAYARALGADEVYFLELYDEECGLCDLITPLCSPRQKVKGKKFLLWNRLLRYGAITCVLTSMIFYMGWQMVSIVEPPSIIVLSPAQDLLTHEATLFVEGVVDAESTVYINGKLVALDYRSHFSSGIDLKRGLNIITIEAERRYSKRSIVERSVVFDPQTGITEVSYFEN